MEHLEAHKELWDKISGLESHITKCEIERATMVAHISELKEENEKKSLWAMRLVGVFAAIMMTVVGAGITMYSTIGVHTVTLEKMDGSISAQGDGLGNALDEVAVIKGQIGQILAEIEALKLEIQDRKNYANQADAEIDYLTLELGKLQGKLELLIKSNG